MLSCSLHSNPCQKKTAMEMISSLIQRRWPFQSSFVCLGFYGLGQPCFSGRRKGGRNIRGTQKERPIVPICFNISFGDEFTPGTSRGEWESRWILTISDSPTPKAGTPLSISTGSSLDLLETQKRLRSRIEGVGEVCSCQAFLSVFHNNRTVSLLWGKEGPSCTGRWRIQSFCKWNS